MSSNSQTQQIRIPNLPTGSMVDTKGNATPEELTFRQTLVTNLQSFFGNEGCVIPTQTPANMLVIQNNSVVNPATGEITYTCLPGTILYVQNATDYTQDKVMIAVRNSNNYPLSAPIFKTVTLT